MEIDGIDAGRSEWFGGVHADFAEGFTQITPITQIMLYGWDG